MRRILCTPAAITLLMAAALLSASPERAVAQYEEAAIGTAVGFVGGSVVTVGVIVARARWQHVYLDSADDLFHWQSAPMIIAPAAGLLFGLAGEEALVGSIIGSTTGMVGGAAIGAGLGWLLSDEQEWPWAGGVIGAALGMTVGGISYGLLRWSRDEEAGVEFPDLLRLGLSIPVR